MCCCQLWIPLFAAEVSPADRQTKIGLELFQRGDFEQAALSWTEASQLYERSGEIRRQSEALVYLSQANQALGRYTEAGKNLELALGLAEKAGDRTQVASVLGALGNLYIATGPGDTALKHLNEGLRIARELNNQDLSATILNNLGNLLTAQKKYAEAIAAYNESATLAKSRNNRVLSGKALINAATASMQNKQYKEAKALLDNALDEIRALEPSHDKASGLITIGLAYDDLRSRLPDLKDSLLLLAHQTFTEAGTISDSMGDRRTSSYAWGYLGKLYEDERRYDEALQLTRRATFAAQQINAPRSLCIAGNGKPDVCSRNKETSTMLLEHTGARCVRFSRYDPSCQPATELHKRHSVKRWDRCTSSWWICFYNADSHCGIRTRSLHT